MKKVNKRVLAEQLMIADGYTAEEAEFFVNCWSDEYISTYIRVNR